MTTATNPALDAFDLDELSETFDLIHCVYWSFTPRGLDAMARHAGFAGFELIDAPVIDGHRRVIGELRSRPPD